MVAKNIRSLHPALRDDIGDLTTRRPMPGPRVQQIDPFLFLNHHGPQTYSQQNRGLPFGPHPHRGFETVTFIVEGELMHRDSAGYESVIRASGVQWMTAGAGIVHAELSPDDFKRVGGPLEILQLWVNLPSRLKMTPPRYQGFQADRIPLIALGSGNVRMQLISGVWGDQRGPVESITGNFMSTLAMDSGARFAADALSGRNVFLYVVAGDVIVNGVATAQHHLVELDIDGDEIVIESTGAARLLFGHGLPIEEPVVSYGPFVMNTLGEIRQAIADYQAGRMGVIRG